MKKQDNAGPNDNDEEGCDDGVDTKTHKLMELHLKCNNGEQLL